MGYLMGCNAESGWQDEQKYLPVIIKLNEAGWQPVTRARANLAVVGIERWGGQEANDPLFFSVMNRSEKAVEAEVIVDLRALRRAAGQKVTMLPGNVSVDADPRSDGLVLHLKLAPEQAAALMVEP
jgi:hypothetical protein